MQRRAIVLLSLFLFALGLSACHVTQSGHTTVENPVTPLSRLLEYKKRFSLFQEEVPLPPPEIVVNHHVLYELGDFMRGDARFVRESYQRRSVFEPIMEEVFIDQGIPLELMNLPLVESGFLNNARSHVGAMGLWQFMPQTARLYNLEVNKENDERLDVVLSTLAACRFLRELYELYDDWNLALAAYNGGSGTLNRAIRRSGSSSFWVVAKRGGLSLETKRFVPRFMAATLIDRHIEQYGLEQLAMVKEQIKVPRSHGWHGSTPAKVHLKKTKPSVKKKKVVKSTKKSTYGSKNRKRS